MTTELIVARYNALIPNKTHRLSDSAPRTVRGRRPPERARNIVPVRDCTEQTRFPSVSCRPQDSGPHSSRVRIRAPQPALTPSPTLHFRARVGSFATSLATPSKYCSANVSPTPPRSRQSTSNVSRCCTYRRRRSFWFGVVKAELLSLRLTVSLSRRPSLSSKNAPCVMQWYEARLVIAGLRCITIRRAPQWGHLNVEAWTPTP
jgi:hypothetical protein